MRFNKHRELLIFLLKNIMIKYFKKILFFKEIVYFTTLVFLI